VLRVADADSAAGCHGRGHGGLKACCSVIVGFFCMLMFCVTLLLFFLLSSLSSPMRIAEFAIYNQLYFGVVSQC
jgi:hypothetical protein